MEEEYGTALWRHAVPAEAGAAVARLLSGEPGAEGALRFPWGAERWGEDGSLSLIIGAPCGGDFSERCGECNTLFNSGCSSITTYLHVAGAPPGTYAAAGVAAESAERSARAKAAAPGILAADALAGRQRKKADNGLLYCGELQPSGWPGACGTSSAQVSQHEEGERQARDDFCGHFFTITREAVA